MTVTTVTPESVEELRRRVGLNRKSVHRARQRARNAMRRMFADEFDELCPKGQRGSSAAQPVLRELARRHPEEYRAENVRQRALETFLPTNHGRLPVVPCGEGSTALKRHTYHGEDFRECPPCAEWFEANRMTSVCKVCGALARSDRTFCDSDCRTIWYSGLRAAAEFTQTRVHQAHSDLRGTAAGENQRRQARRILEEFERTGKVERRRTTGAHGQSHIRQLAEAKGLDYDALLATAQEVAV